MQVSLCTREFPVDGAMCVVWSAASVDSDAIQFTLFFFWIVTATISHYSVGGRRSATNCGRKLGMSVLCAYANGE